MPYVLVDSDDGASFRTGRIIGQVRGNYFLVQFDNMNNSNKPSFPPTLVHLEEMTDITHEGYKRWSFFESAEARAVYMDWLDAPSSPKVVNLVKK